MLEIPFYLGEWESENGKQWMKTLFMVIADLTIAISSGVLGYVLKEKKVVSVFRGSVYMISTPVILMGTTYLYGSGAVFVIFTSLYRLLEGLGKCMFFIASIKLLTNFFEETSTALSIVEFFNRLGWALGAFIGKPAYESMVMSFSGPFGLIGGLMNGVMGFHWCLYRECYYTKSPIESANDKKPTVVEMCKKVSLWVAIYLVFVSSASWGFLYLRLESHMKELKLSTIEGNSILLAGTLSVAVVTPIWARLGSKFGHFNLLQAATLFSFIGLSILAPMAEVTGSKDISSICTGLGLFGAGSGGCFILALLCLIQEAGDSIFVTGLWLAADALGNLTGYALSETYDLMKFTEVIALMIGLYLVSFVTIILFALGMVIAKKRVANLQNSFPTQTC